MMINDFSDKTGRINLGNSHSYFDAIAALSEIASSHPTLLTMAEIVIAKHFSPKQSFTGNYACPNN